MERRYEHGEYVWFVANGWKVIQAIVQRDDGDSCIILFDRKKVIRLRSSRLYRTEEEAKQNVTWIVQRRETPKEAEGRRADPARKYAHQYEWMADHHMA